MPHLTLHDLPFEMVPLEVRLLVETTSAAFPSPAQDDMDDPIDLASWLSDQVAIRDAVSRAMGMRPTGSDGPSRRASQFR